MTIRRSKSCKVCKHKFKPTMTTQVVCSPKCAIQWAKIKREKDFDKETRQRKQKLKSRSDYIREAQKAVNYYVRLRDKDKPCVSCGRFHQGRWDAGHYLSIGARPELRFNLWNIHKQCHWNCNIKRSGNIALYRIELIKRIGLEKVEWLEGPHPKQRYDRAHLVRIKTIFNRKAKLLLKRRGNH